MKITGLITEYNPFHNGHLYHMNTAREVTGCDAVIVVMSGDYVQRGEPAFLPKHLRARMALEAGADLVIELPLRFASGSAEYFARGAVSLLDAAGCVDALCFGCESADLNALSAAAAAAGSESDAYKELLRHALGRGASFPAARQEALSAVTGDPQLAGLVSAPNNILAIEYLKALGSIHSAIRPCPVRRRESGYHDLELSRTFSSATALRRLFADTAEDPARLFKTLKEQVPEAALKLMKESYGRRFPVTADDFSLLLQARLLEEDAESLCRYQDVSVPLANKIISRRNYFSGFDGFCRELKSKDLTYSRISRALLHILLQLKKQPDQDSRIPITAPYLRILGINKRKPELLTLLKAKSAVPILTKATKKEALSAAAAEMLEEEIHASNLYEAVISQKYHQPFMNEYQQSLVFVR